MNRLYSEVVRPAAPPSVAAVQPAVASEDTSQPEVVEIQPVDQVVEIYEDGWQFVGRKSRRKIDSKKDSRTTPMKRKISREESANTRKRHMASRPPKVAASKTKVAASKNQRKRALAHSSSPQHAKGRPGRCSKEPAAKVTSQLSDSLIF